MAIMTNLIPLSYLNEACFLSLNIDAKKFQMVLKLAQEDLRDVLGTEFYDEIVSQYPSSLSTDNAALYEDYLKDFLAWQTYLHHLKFSQSESTPTGERQFKDDNSELLAGVNLWSKEKNIQNTANRYKNKIVNYLREEQSKDSTKFPKWTKTYKPPLGFAISAITRGNMDAVISINKTQYRNE